MKVVFNTGFSFFSTLTKEFKFITSVLCFVYCFSYIPKLSAFDFTDKQSEENFYT